MRQYLPRTYMLETEVSDDPVADGPLAGPGGPDDEGVGGAGAGEGPGQQGGGPGGAQQAGRLGQQRHRSLKQKLLKWNGESTKKNYVGERLGSGLGYDMVSAVRDEQVCGVVQMVTFIWYKHIEWRLYDPVRPKLPTLVR